jgi:predicted dehydrogenase/threonine dehydrogenase-like Zn-dependent dehydrogenase
MKQVIRRGLKEIIVDEVPDPAPTPHHVVVRPLYSLISSGTETASIHQDSIVKEVAERPSLIRMVLNTALANGPAKTYDEVQAKFKEYAVLGYSGAGIIVEKHSTVPDLPLGTRVAYGGEGTGHGEMILTGRNLVAPIPEAVPYDQACFATLGSIALNSIRVANIGIGETVAIIGQGLVGQLVTQLARCQGAQTIAIDLQASRLDLARQLGADRTIVGGDSAAVMAQVREFTSGRGADCVIVAAAAKSAAPCHQALDICRDRGRIVVVGAVEMSFPWNDMYMKEIELRMARAYGPGSYDADYEKRGRDYPISYVRWTENRNMEEFLRLIATGQVRVEPLITHRFPLQEAPKAYDTILTPSSGSLAVVLRYDEPPAVEQIRPLRKVAIGGAKPAASGVLQVALAGAGNIARWAHMPGLQKQSNARLRAVFSANGARGKSYGIRYKAEYCCSTYEELLNDQQLDAILIATRNQYHAAQTVAALRAGKHVFVEKPMALTDAECAEIAQAANDSGRQVVVGFNRRFAPYYRELKKNLARRSGPAVISCRMNSPGISGAYWMADPSIGGAVLGEACHFTDLFYWLLDAEPVSVFAYSLPLESKDPIGENNLAATFRFADGSIANLTYCTVGSKTSGGERLEVFAPGLGGCTEDFQRLAVNTSSRSNSKLWFPEKGYDAQMAAFVARLRSGPQPDLAGLEDGIRSTVTCLRMLDAARSGQPQPVDWKKLLP